MNRRVAVAVAVAVVMVIAVISVLLVRSDGSPSDTRVNAASAAADDSPTTSSTTTALTTAPAPPTSTTSRSAHRTPTTQKPSVLTPTTATTQPATSSGSANLTYSGVIEGPLLNPIAVCEPRPSASSEIRVNGTLNGTPWVFMVNSYNGETGVWQVLTGEAGGGTGLIGQGYRTTADYPATVEGVTNVDWAHGATVDVQLPSGEGQMPAGNLTVRGTITCA